MWIAHFSTPCTTPSPACLCIMPPLKLDGAAQVFTLACASQRRLTEGCIHLHRPPPPFQSSLR